MQTLEELLAARCRGRASGAMSAAAIERQLQVLPDWRLDRGALARTFRFAGYCETIAFVNALAYMVHAEDHHPELTIGYDTCAVRLHTHSAGGITDNDFICAAKADAVHARRYAPPTA